MKYTVHDYINLRKGCVYLTGCTQNIKNPPIMIMYEVDGKCLDSHGWKIPNVNDIFWSVTRGCRFTGTKIRIQYNPDDVKSDFFPNQESAICFYKHHAFIQSQSERM